MKKVYCIGELLIDFVSNNGEEYSKKPGGAPANVAVAISKLGGKAYFLGQVGKDNFGKYLEEVLIDNNVDTKYLKKEGRTTLAMVSLDKSGERNFDFYRGGDGEYEVDINDLSIDSDTIVHFGSATAFLPGNLRNTYYKVLEDAKNKKATITFDPNYRDTLIKDYMLDQFVSECIEFLKVCNFAKLSDEELTLITKEKDLDIGVKKLHELGVKVVTITIGSKGTYLSVQGENSIIPSINIKQVDSTGAGDAFVGAVLKKVAEIKDKKSITVEEWKNIISFANKVGAITCTNYGAIPSIPTLDEIEVYFDGV